MKRFQVVVDPEIEPIMDRFMEIRHKELVEMTAAAGSGDDETVRLLGHRLKGAGGSYGMDGLSELGKGIEAAALSGDLDSATVLIERVGEYLEGVDIVYQEPDAS